MRTANKSLYLVEPCTSKPAWRSCYLYLLSSSW